MQTQLVDGLFADLLQVVRFLHVYALNRIGHPPFLLRGPLTILYKKFLTLLGAIFVSYIGYHFSPLDILFFNSFSCPLLGKFNKTIPFYTAKNAKDLLQVVNFTGLLQLVNKLQQTCQFHQAPTSLLKLSLLQLVICRLVKTCWNNL